MIAFANLYARNLIEWSGAFSLTLGELTTLLEFNVKNSCFHHLRGCRETLVG